MLHACKKINCSASKTDAQNRGQNEACWYFMLFCKSTVTSKVSLGQTGKPSTGLIRAVPTQSQPALSQMSPSPKVAVTETINQQLFSSPGNLSKAKIHHKTASPEVLLAPPPQPPPSDLSGFHSALSATSFNACSSPTHSCTGPGTLSLE